MTTIVRKARAVCDNLPKGWTCRRLRFDAHLNPKKSSLDMEPDELVSFIPMDAVGEYGGLDLENVRELEDVYDGYTYFTDGDLCIAKITPCFENGKGALAEGLTNAVGFGTTELHVVRPGPNIDRHFLFYASIADDFRKFGESEMYGAGGQKRIDESFIKNWMVPLPPLNTQRRIARFLDEKTARIDGLIEKKRALLDRLAEQRQALITRAVTTGLDAPVESDRGGHYQARRGHRRAAEGTGGVTMPLGWQELPLNRIIRMRSGDFISNDDIEPEGFYPVYGGNGFRGFTDQFNAVGPIVLVGRQGAHCGNVHVADGEIWVSEHALRCLPERELVAKWLAYALRDMDLNQYSVSAAQPGLSVDNLKHLRKAVPPLDTQRRIARFLDEKTARIDELVEKICESIARLQEYRAAQITAVVTGQITELI